MENRFKNSQMNLNYLPHGQGEIARWRAKVRKWRAVVESNPFLLLRILAEQLHRPFPFCPFFSFPQIFCVNYPLWQPMNQI